MIQLILTLANTPPSTYTIIQRRDRNVSVIKPVMLGGRKIRLENLTPILSSKEREEREREIESRLYDIFVRYAER